MDVDAPAPAPAPAPTASSSTPAGLPRADNEEPQRASSVPLHAKEYAVGYVYAPEMMLHSSEQEHPEQPGRIFRIYNILNENGCIKRMKRIPIRKAKRDEVLLVHSEKTWQSIMTLKSLTAQDIANSEAYYDSLSLYVHPETPNCARLSCGGVIEAAMAVARNELQKSFAIVRPPGHHAEPEKPMGFCFFNNVAVAVRVVQQLTKIKRVMILDWDVHHGNGTQRCFNDDPSVLYMSLHRYEQGRFYPCGPFGSMVSCGEGAGRGFSVNIPWPDKGMGDADYLHAFQRIVMPIAMEFSPELVIISAGFDAADGDPLGQCHVSPAGYAHMTHMLSGLAGGKLVVALEGGYSLDSISKSALEVGRTILGQSPPELPPLVASEIATETVWQVALEQSKYWKNIDPKACEPSAEIDQITYTIPELLKAHRQEYMYREYEMLEVPLLHEDHQDKFSSQIMCTKDIMDNEVLVVFAHEFGNIRAEIADGTTCSIREEHSYLVDTSKQLVAWVQTEGYALLDVNLFPKPGSPELMYAPRSPEQYAKEIMTYLWDNYILLSNAKRVILVGHGPGVLALTELLAARPAGVMRQVELIVQVVGYGKIPLVPSKQGADLIAWYRTHSLVVVPRDHSILRDGKVLKRHGLVTPIDESKSIKLMMRALPLIQKYVKNCLQPEQAVNGS
ncbi:histone deacetylase complex protein [Dentipellis sp. KUC8613]|nr:histone deacetylase complex protein [Dentipellis sp. KUC8613]